MSLRPSILVATGLLLALAACGGGSSDGGTPAARCGDGVKAGTETCDDGNTTNGDGCSSSCSVEAGFNCTGSPSICGTACGDGVRAGAETCDDGNATSGDGCSSSCSVEAGFSCTGSPSVCSSTAACGDGLLAPGEACDDGNVLNGDGCSALCTIEPGSSCSGSPSVCTLSEVEPNGTVATATANGLVVTRSTSFAAALTPAGDEDLFRIVATAGTVLRLEAFDASGADCVGLPALRVALLDSAGTLLKADSQSGISSCGAVVAPVGAGTWFASVGQPSAAAVAAYRLEVAFVRDGGGEIEGNDTRATATPLPYDDVSMAGDRPTTADVDYYRISVAAGRSIRAEVIEADGGPTCESNQLDSMLRLYDASGAPLTSDDDGGRGFCSLIDGTGSAPAAPGAHGLPGGVYFIEVNRSPVTSGPAGAFPYRLVVTVR